MARIPIGLKIRERRKLMGYTQAKLAKSLNISASYLNLIEANKRYVSGALVKRAAEFLEVDISYLTGEAERRLVEDLREISANVAIKEIQLSSEDVSEFVTRYPKWASAIVHLHRAYKDQQRTTALLSQRLSHDPMLSEDFHQMLTHITTIRSNAEILQNFKDLSDDEIERFQSIITSETYNLTDVARSLVTFFDQAKTKVYSSTPSEEVEDIIIEEKNHFPLLEQQAEKIHQDLDLAEPNLEFGIVDHLKSRYGVSVRFSSASKIPTGKLRHHCYWDQEGRKFYVSDTCPRSTMRFQMTRLLCRFVMKETIDYLTDDDRLSTDEAKEKAAWALTSYAASAILFPYDKFLEDAVTARYDIEVLAQIYKASFEQIGHRLVTLRKSGKEGLPFGFLRADPAGRLTKRFSVPGLQMPRIGHACPLWVIYSCFQTPNKAQRQLVEMPDGGRYLFVAKTVTKQTANFHEVPFLSAVMLACNVLYVDQTVYGDGLDLHSAHMSVPVGSTCRLCLRTNCPHRQEDTVLAT